MSETSRTDYDPAHNEWWCDGTIVDPSYIQELMESLTTERDNLKADLAEVNEKNEKLFNHTTRLSKKLREEQNLNDGLIKQLKEK